MLRQILVGIAVSVCNIAIHAMFDGGRNMGGAHRGCDLQRHVNRFD